MSDFIYCLNSSTIKPTPILEKIRIAGELGYEAIELWHDDIDLHVDSGGSVKEIRTALDDQNLTVPTTIFLKGWFDTTGAELEAELEECKRRMAIAAELGAIHCISGPTLGKADLDLAAKNYHTLLELGLSMGVKPALEYLGFADEFNNIPDAMSVLNKAGHAEGTIVHDPFHIFRGGGTFADVETLNPNQIAIFHFNDAPPTPQREQQHDIDRVMPGDGHLDLQGLIQSLRKTGYDRWISLELFREDLWQQDPREVAHVGLEKMKAIIES